MTTLQPINKRGRKSSMPPLDTNEQIHLQQHHFNYSDNFAEMLANFAALHLEDKSKDFKASWKTWTANHTAEIKTETEKMKGDGYLGDVAEKMYFSARYYYRKKAIRERTAAPDISNQEAKSPRKKYEAIDKSVLVQMNDHIILQFRLNTDGSKLTPSKAFANYCKKHDIKDDDAKLKKTYKNVYWRMSMQVTSNNK